jgi:inhibitor of cysteine peptidase
MIITISSLLLLIFALVCPAGSSMTNGAPDIVTVTEKDNGGQVEVAVGGVLRVKLEAIPGTGYSWHMVGNDPDLLNPLGSSIFEPMAEESRKGLIGGPAYQTFRFRAMNSGTDLLQLHYKRGWEEKAAPIKTFSITVQIQ